MARPAGFEPATLCLEGRCSIQLSYGRNFSLLSSLSILSFLSSMIFTNSSNWGNSKNLKSFAFCDFSFALILVGARGLKPVVSRLAFV